MCGPKPLPDVPTSEVPSSLQRIARLPVVDVAVSIYVKVKDSSPAPLRWGLSKAEGSAFYLVGHLDPILSKGLDVIESRAETTHRYVQEAIVKPVILRAGSVTEFSIKQANTCMDYADRYVETYLPAIEKSDAPNNPSDNEEDQSGPTMQAIHRADCLSRKLQRRLTERTLTEARAFRHAGVEIIRWISQMAKLLAHDPRAFHQKLKAGWSELSLPEPENQTRPKTIEELVALLVREGVRRLVHLTNKGVALGGTLTRRLKHFTHQRIEQGRDFFYHLENHVREILEDLACKLAGRPNQSNMPITIRRRTPIQIQSPAVHLSGTESEKQAEKQMKKIRSESSD